MAWIAPVAEGALSAGASIFDSNNAQKAQQAAVAPLQQANSTLYNKAETIANTPYTPYTGQQVAPITGGQQQAVDLAQTNATNEVGQQDVGNATALAGDVAGNSWNSATAAKYMNPYTSSVIAGAQKELNQSYANTINTQNLNSASQGAFGGDRAALTNAASAGEYELQSGEMSAQLNANAYNSAIQTWQADNNRMLSAAQSYQASGNDITNMNSSQIKDLLATGGVAQATEQMDLNAKYNDYLDARGWSANELQPLLQATSGKGTPAGVAPTNIATDILGMGSALAGYFGSTSGPGNAPASIIAGENNTSNSGIANFNSYGIGTNYNTISGLPSTNGSSYGPAISGVSAMGPP